MSDATPGIRGEHPEPERPALRLPPRRRRKKRNPPPVFVNVLITIGGCLVFFGLLGLMMFKVAGAYSITILVLGMSMVYGWMLFAHLEYRRGRRSELLYLLAAAAASGAPLAQALRAYLSERPKNQRSLLFAVPLFFLLPGYYWFLHTPFDRLVENLADRLEAGESLTEALRAVPAVVSREGHLAAEIGHVTGQLGACLRRTVDAEKSASWIEPVVRSFYTLALVFFTSLITLFWAKVLLPRMERILQDFKMPMPAVTGNLVQWTGPIAVLALLLGVLELTGLVLLNRTVRWYFPIVGRLYRLHLQGRLSRGLGLTLEAGMPAPKALALLADSPSFPGPMQACLEQARTLVERGEALGPSLQQQGLLPMALLPLTQAAERAHNLPPALRSMGDHLTARAARLLRRASLLIFPAGVVAVGALVAFVVLGMFMPLIQILEVMTE